MTLIGRKRLEPHRAVGMSPKWKRNTLAMCMREVLPTLIYEPAVLQVLEGHGVVPRRVKSRTTPRPHWSQWGRVGGVVEIVELGGACAMWNAQQSGKEPLLCALHRLLVI